MSYVLQIQWLEGTSVIPGNVDGQFVKAFDPNAFDGMGDLTTTQKIEEAKRFPDAKAAMEFYRQTSKVRPIRPDGRPNRPLTAFTVSIERAGDEDEGKDQHAQQQAAE